MVETSFYLLSINRMCISAHLLEKNGKLQSSTQSHGLPIFNFITIILVHPVCDYT